MNSFSDIWRGHWAIRDITWKNFERACEGCPIRDEHYFCTGRCPGSSSVHNKRLDGCGMTPFQIRSVQRREALFRQTVKSEPQVRVIPTVQLTDSGDVVA
jgi:hypothetical protein